MDEKKRKGFLRNEDTRNYAVISALVLSILFLISPYSPIYRYIFEMDEVCYKIMSVGLFQGKVPYRDLFDHKGPLTYFLYGIGFFIARNHNWGVFLICFVCNAIAFIYVYKCSRLFFPARISMFSTILIIVVNAITLQNIFKSGSKPDNLMLAPLMISAYLFFKETVAPDIKDFEKISNRSMFIMGILCGIIFMTKLNICLLYFVFIGCYLLWLLIRKKITCFFAGAGLFAGGIVLASLPCVLYLAANQALSDFWNVYFVFNLNYSKSSEGLFYLTNQSVTVPAKVSITLIILISALGLFLAHAGKKLNRQRWVLIILSAVSFLVMGMPACITYFFIVFVPLYTPAFGVVSELLCSLMPDEKSTTQIIGIMAVMLPIFLGMQLYMAKYFQIGKTEKEIALEAFEEKCPDASCLYFDFPCAVGFYEHCPKTPDFRMFYKPPITTEDFRQEHLDAVRNRLPDTIVYWSEGNETKDSNRCRFIEENGYVLYGVYHDDYTVEYFYVRDDLPIA